MLRIGCCILFTVFALVVQPVEAGSPAGETAVTGVEQTLAEARDRAAAVDVTELVKRVQETGQTMGLPENVATAEGSKAARQVLERFQAPVFQEVLQEQERSIMQKMNIEIPMATSGKPEEESSAESFHLFFSSAMPEETVHAYLEDIARAGSDSITPVLHGFPFGLSDKAGNGRYFNRVLQQDPACRDTPDLCCRRLEVAIRINPALFAQYGITGVPALVYVSGEDSWSIQGDAGLAALLERISREVSSPVLTRLISTLGEGR
jgi:conjugal transfer pilus assembly protein TrbC